LLECKKNGKTPQPDLCFSAKPCIYKRRWSNEKSIIGHGFVLLWDTKRKYNKKGCRLKVSVNLTQSND
jgi:hypothetical protein